MTCTTRWVIWAMLRKLAASSRRGPQGGHCNKDVIHVRAEDHQHVTCLARMRCPYTSNGCGTHLLIRNSGVACQQLNHPLSCSKISRNNARKASAVRRMSLHSILHLLISAVVGAADHFGHGQARTPDRAQCVRHIAPHCIGKGQWLGWQTADGCAAAAALMQVLHPPVHIFCITCGWTAVSDVQCPDAIPVNGGCWSCQK